jgi:hypothetical protein
MRAWFAVSGGTAWARRGKDDPSRKARGASVRIFMAETLRNAD